MEPFLTDFLQALGAQKGYSENTVVAYKNDLTQFGHYVLTHQGGAFDPASITPALVGAYPDYLQSHNGGYAPSTVARKIAAVKSFFHYLADRQLVASDPASKLNSPRIKKSVPRTLTQPELELLLAAPRRGFGPKSLRDAALLELLAATGLRVTEVVNLRQDDIDWERGEVLCRGKADRNRHVPLGTARQSLETYLKQARPELAGEGSGDALFLNHRGKKLTRQGVWLIIKEAADAAGISTEVTPHTLRHSFARYLVGSGADLRRVQELLGHANLSTTQVYRQPNNNHTAHHEPAAV